MKGKKEGLDNIEDMLLDSAIEGECHAVLDNVNEVVLFVKNYKACCFYFFLFHLKTYLLLFCLSCFLIAFRLLNVKDYNRKGCRKYALQPVLFQVVCSSLVQT